MTSTSNNDTEEKKMFFTTSDLVRKMNASMKEANILPGAASAEDHDDTHSSGGDGGGFELQRKMPDGSYRRADEKEVAAADFQSKMKQASEAIKTLNPYQKIEWARYQRKEGNVLFAKGEYKEAMDVYLTCLVAMDQSSSSSSSPHPSDAASVPLADDDNEKTNIGRRNNDDFVTNDDDDEEEQQLNMQIEKDIKLPVLLNLALSALKLGMLSKAEQFCNHAIETELGKQSVKAHFRRGRVRMLMGHFVSAELDLDRAHELIDTNMNMIMSDNNIVTDNNNDREENNQKLKELEDEKTVILREKQKLNRLVNHAHENEKQQKKAMQKLFNSNEQQQRQHAKGQVIQDGLYPEKVTPASIKQSNEQSEIANEYYSQPTTYFQWYMQMIGRCAQKILDVIGHGDDDEPVEVPVDQDLLETLMNDKKNA